MTSTVSSSNSRWNWTAIGIVSGIAFFLYNVWLWKKAEDPRQK